MSDEDAPRKLATILAMDVVGYSRMMGEDEEGTLRTFRKSRKTIKGLMGKFRGRIFKEAGDAILSEFVSTVDAVRCAIAIQEELSTINHELAEDRQMWFRIGINIGDVMVEGDDLFGDGVNVAARLEGLAERGGICISGSVFEQVKNKLSVAFHDAGPQKLKNINYPVNAYRLIPGEVRVETRSRARHAAIALVIVIALGAGSAYWFYPLSSDDADLQRFDGRWEVTVDQRVGCRNNEPVSYPVLVADGAINEPSHRVPKRGTVSGQGHMLLELLDPRGEVMSTVEAIIKGNAGLGRMSGISDRCTGNVSLRRMTN